jgi:hypothetical protein
MATSEASFTFSYLVNACRCTQKYTNLYGEDRVLARPIMPRFLSGHPLLLTQDPPQTLQAANPSGPHATHSHT